MIQFIIRRLIASIPVLLGIVLLVFVLVRVIPGDPCTATYGEKATPELCAQFAVRYGLDKPIWEQFLIYVGHLFKGDLGTSFALYPASVRTLIVQALPWSIALQVPAILLGWIVGNLLGAVAAYRAGWFDRGAFLGSLFVSSMPYYCLAIVLLYVFAVLFVLRYAFLR